jgi:hypothetical protein
MLGDQNGWTAEKWGAQSSGKVLADSSAMLVALHLAYSLVASNAVSDSILALVGTTRFLEGTSLRLVCLQQT